MMNAIIASLLLDHNIDLSERNMQHKVWREVKNSILFYVEFTVNKTQDKVLHDVNKYLRSYGKNYTLPIIDVIVGACANSKYLKIIRDSKKKLISNLRRTNHHYLYIYSTVEMPAQGKILIMPMCIMMLLF